MALITCLRVQAKSLSQPASFIHILRSIGKPSSPFHSPAISLPMQGRKHFSASAVTDEHLPDQTDTLLWYKANRKPTKSRRNIVVPDAMPYSKFRGKYSTPLMSRREAEMYLRPLFYRGWDIQTTDSNNGSNLVQESPSLVGSLTLTSSRPLHALISLLAVISKRENHHVISEFTDGPRPVLTIIAQTHSARNNASSSPSLRDLDAIYPGITLRDVRLAALLEKMAFEKNYLYRPKTVFSQTDIDRFVYEKDMAWEKLMTRFHGNYPRTM